MIQGIIFDLFDTLIYIEPSVLNSELDKMARVAGVSGKVFRENWAPKSAIHRLKYFKGRVDLSGYFATVLKEMGKEPNPEVLNRIIEIRLAMREHVRYFEDTLPALAELRNRGYKLGLISNLGSLWGTVFDKLKLKHYFDVISLSYEVGLAKPEPEIYLATAQKMGCAPTQCMFIDDQPDYVLAAEEVGMTGIWLNRDDNSDGKTKHQLVSLREIIAILDSLK
jgi:putative hydrolase of the HAD superfamily